MITALFALLSAAIAAAVALLVADRTRYVNAVTAQRSEWIEKLRNNLAKYSGIIRSMNYKIGASGYNLQSAEHYESIRQANDLIPLIKLQLNPFGKIDNNIVRLLDKMAALAEKADGKRLVEADKLFIEHSRWLLKAEWEKVKSEAAGILFCGIVVRRGSKENEHEYLNRYRTFCDGAGNLAKLDEPTQ